MQAGDALHDRQPEPATGDTCLIASNEGSQHGSTFGWIEPWAAIEHVDLHIRVVHIQAQCDLATAVTACVLQQVHDRALEGHRTHAHLGQDRSHAPHVRVRGQLGLDTPGHIGAPT